MSDLGRRDFLKVVGLTGTTAAVSCSSESARKLIPYIIPPEDIVPGKANWYATTCRECPAGCGLLAKNRDGRVIKVEGNPLHPVNRGRLCARGQASLHGLYNPDRIQGPLRKDPQGRFEPVTWDRAEEILVQNLLEIAKEGRGERVAFVSELVGDSLRHLVGRWVRILGAKGPIVYEPFAYEPLRKANRVVFGVDSIPAYRIDQGDFLISFGADFLETWLSPVEYAVQFASFHEPRDAGKSAFVYVGPRLSMTAANGDHWVSVPAGGEYLVALGMIRIILEGHLALTIPQAKKDALRAVVKDWPLDAIKAKTGVNEKVLRGLARRFAKARRPLALAGGVSSSGANGTGTAVAANLLCAIKGGSLECLDFAGKSALSEVARAAEIKALSERMREGEVDLLLIYNVNPLFSLPSSWEFRKALEAVPLVVSFSGTLDETSALAHLVFPTHTPLESWGDYAPRAGVEGLMQPVMGPMFDTRHIGDILLSTGKKVGGTKQFPWKTMYHILRDSWRQKGKGRAPSVPFERFWQEAMRRGGSWESRSLQTPEVSWKDIDFSFPPPDSSAGSSKGFHFIAYPTIQFFDGRGANRPWLQELPDPMTQMTWGPWVEIHPETAKSRGIERGDLLRLESTHGSLEIPAFPYAGVPEDTLAMPIGQGHTVYGRFAKSKPGTPIHLLPGRLDESSGGLLWSVSHVSIKKLERAIPMAHTDGSYDQRGRGIAQAISLEDYRQAKRAGHKPHIDLPLPEGYDPKEDFYPPHRHVDYRWAMVVDLDRCIGCGACVVACYAENNVAIVGKKLVLQGREMSWIRVQRYFEPGEPVVRFFTMLCQHCDNAPCESVCPVYAPHHSVEGLNNQVYNRCIGTRFCSQNCPYKVRRFNWFTFTRAEPLNWQLNPDVTVRQKGVMEKCSFCVQRIVEAKNRARNEGRKVRDGDVIPACVQSCPTAALTFGNLKDPNSRVTKSIRDPRAYQAFEHLNTKPAVIYLKKVTTEVFEI